MLVVLVRLRFAIAVLLILSTIGSAAFFVRNYHEKYTSTAVLSLSPRSDGAVGADNVKLAASRYRAMLSAAATLTTAAQKAGSAPLSEAAKITVPPQTVTILVEVTLSDAPDAAQAANALASAALRQGTTDNLVIVNLLAPAITATSPSSLPQKWIEALAAGGVLLVVAVAIGGVWRLRKFA